MKRVSLILAGLAVVALAALGDWTIGVVGNVVQVEGNAIQAGGAWSPTNLVPVAWWKGDGNATDSSGNGRNGAWTAPPETYATGPWAGVQAFAFAGTNIVAVANDAVLQLTNNAPYSIAYWVRAETTGLLMSTVMKGTINSSYGHLIGAGNTKYLLAYQNGWTPVLQVDSFVIGVAWVHIVQTYDGSIVRFYVNGALAATSDSGKTLTTNTSTLMIGAEPSASYKYVGRLAQVMFWSRTLTPTEAAKLAAWRGN